MQIIVQMFFIMYAYHSDVGEKDFVEKNSLILVMLSNLLCLLILTVIFRLRKKRLLTEINAVYVSAKTYILPIVCTTSYSVVFSMICYNIEFANSTAIVKSIQHYSNILWGSGIVILILSTLIVTPIVEETICRGLMITYLKQSVSPTTAIVFSSLLFGAIHILAGGMLLAISSSIAGLLFGIVFEKTHSLRPAIVAHIAANLPGIAMMILPAPTIEIRISIGLLFTMVFIFNFILMLKSGK